MLLKLKEKHLNEEIQGTIITYTELRDINNIPLSSTTMNNIEIFIPVKIIYKIYKPGDIILGELFIDDPVFLISNELICEIQNNDILINCDIKTKVTVEIQNIKGTSGCSYLLAEGILLTR